MEFLGILGFIFGIFAWFKVSSLSQKVRKLEDMMKESGHVDVDKESLAAVLKKNIGNRVRIEVEDEWTYYDVLSRKPCLILDVDEAWVKFRADNKTCDEFLVRIEVIGGLQFEE